MEINKQADKLFNKFFENASDSIRKSFQTEFCKCVLALNKSINHESDEESDGDSVSNSELKIENKKLRALVQTQQYLLETFNQKNNPDNLQYPLFVIRYNADYVTVSDLLRYTENYCYKNKPKFDSWKFSSEEKLLERNHELYKFFNTDSEFKDSESEEEEFDSELEDENYKEYLNKDLSAKEIQSFFESRTFEGYRYKFFQNHETEKVFNFLQKVFNFLQKVYSDDDSESEVYSDDDSESSFIIEIII